MRFNFITSPTHIFYLFSNSNLFIVINLPLGSWRLILFLTHSFSIHRTSLHLKSEKRKENETENEKFISCSSFIAFPNEAWIKLSLACSWSFLFSLTLFWMYLTVMSAYLSMIYNERRFGLMVQNLRTSIQLDMESREG